MEFHHWRPYWNPNACRWTAENEALAYEHWYGVQEATGGGRHSSGSLNAQAKAMAQVELWWLHEVRPYYKLWPTLLPSLLRVSLDLPANKVPLAGEMSVAIRFAVGHEPAVGEWYLTSLLLFATSKQQALIIIAHVQQRSGCDNPVMMEMAQTLDTSTEKIVEETVSEKSSEIGSNISTDQLPSEQQLQLLTDIAARAAVGILLLAHDDRLFERDVLVKDAKKYAATADEKYVEKARKRGVNGWTLGRNMETMPHFRRGHLHLYWTGKGRTIPRILLLDRMVIHRKKVTTVPTGYTLPNGIDVEPDEE